MRRTGFKSRGVRSWLRMLLLRDYAKQATLYLNSIPQGEESLATIRARSESAEALLRDRVFADSVQLLNEQIIREIAESPLLAKRRRDVLYLKLALVSEVQEALLTQMSMYETTATIREGLRRAEMEKQSDYETA